ncbi:hypothetical protein [Bradyrhizobium sp. Mp27]|uniref:hypothetical protein n=1 Tax=Bradyrhizobium sp. Mp27 TaxID=3042157 RepID=UPI00248C9ED3|nr:hypothetical protein [Bradyrhizobium sp. Mp27]MDI2077407.1 hypothetical protein [Bradyrhizobium sp. Mp27]
MAQLSPMRRRMIEDMTVRKVPSISNVKKASAKIKRNAFSGSPSTSAGRLWKLRYVHLPAIPDAFAAAGEAASASVGAPIRSPAALSNHLRRSIEHSSC